MCDFEFEPVDFTGVKVTEEDLAKFVAESQQNKKYRDSLLNLTQPDWPIENVLARVGIKRAGFKFDLSEFVPHARAFDVFGLGKFTINMDGITGVDIPSLGAETVTNGVLASSAISTTTGAVCYGQTTVNKVIGAARPKVDGVEVVQFVVHTLYDDYCFVYDSDSIYPVSGVETAVYEKVDGEYFLLRGIPAPEMVYREHNYVEPTRRNLQKMVDESEGAILNINGFDYRVKNEHIVTLSSVFGHVLDGSGVTYESAGASPMGLGDYRLIGERRVEFVKARPDKLAADGNVMVQTTARAPVLKDILCRFPIGPQAPIRLKEIRYEVPQSEEYLDYQARSFAQSCVGPFTWKRAVHRKLDSGEAVVEDMVASGFVSVTPHDIDKYCASKNIFLTGQSVRRLMPIVNDLLIPMKGCVFSTRLRDGFESMLLVRSGLNPTFDRLLQSHVFFHGGNVPYYALYFKKGELLPLTTGVAAAASSTLELSHVIEFLEKGPASLPTMCLCLKVHRHILGRLLASRRDLFVHQGGEFPVWRLVTGYKGVKMKRED